MHLHRYYALLIITALRNAVEGNRLRLRYPILQDGASDFRHPWESVAALLLASKPADAFHHGGASAHSMIASLLAPQRKRHSQMQVTQEPPPLERPTIPFEDWAEANAINAPKVAVTGTSVCRTVKLLDSVAAGEEIVSLPRPACLDLNTLTEDAGSPCPDLIPTSLWEELRWWERLAVWLLGERRRGKISHVSGYMGYLPSPEQFADSPLEWTDEELAVLSYPPVVIGVKEQRAEIDDLLQRIKQQGGPQAQSVTLEELRWALQNVHSRAFMSRTPKPAEVERNEKLEGGEKPSLIRATARAVLEKIPVVNTIIDPWRPTQELIPDGDRLQMAMMPMMDAFNHRSSAKNECAFDPDRNAFILTALVPLQKGEEACISYGKKSNNDLLQLFGFVEEKNPHDTFLTMGLREFIDDPGAGFFRTEESRVRRFQELEEYGLDQYLLGDLKATGPPKEMLVALRMLFGDADERLAGPKFMTEPQSLETEDKVWATLVAYCNLASAGMAGGDWKADSDFAGRARSAGDERTFLALKFRSEKKRLLRDLGNSLASLQKRSRKAGVALKKAKKRKKGTGFA